jgi:hypothetical protein
MNFFSFDVEDAAHDLLGDPLEVVFRDEYRGSFAGDILPAVIQARIVAVVGYAVAYERSSKNLLPLALSVCRVTRVARVLRLERSKGLLHDARGRRVVGVKAEPDLEHEVLFELAVVRVARDAARYLPLLKVGRRRIRVPRLRKDVIGVALLHVLQAVDALPGPELLLRHSGAALADSQRLGAASDDGGLVAQVGEGTAALAVHVVPGLPRVLGTGDADCLVEFVERRITGAVPVPEALDGSSSELLALVGPENLKIDGELHAVSRVVKAYRGDDVALGLGRSCGELEDAAKDSVLRVLARLPGGPDGGEHVGGYVDGAHKNLSFSSYLAIYSVK